MTRSRIGKSGVRSLATVGAAFGLAASTLALAGASTASAQEAVPVAAVPVAISVNCDTVDLGMLDTTPGSKLTASGRWTTEDCDSRFRSGSDAHTYRFEIAETGRIRVDVMSSETDSYLYLLDGTGNRITEDDDSGVGALDARIERELNAGIYLIEATTTAGRSRGPADFQVVVTQVDTCEPEVLGALTPGEELKVTGFWTPESCQSIFLTGHPSHYFVFTLPQGARVRIDLTSEIGDTVLIVAPIVALRSVIPGQVAHNDDVDGTRNSRIEQYLPPDVYAIEATTFRTRDLQGPQTDFTLTLNIVEEEEAQRDPLLKIEKIDIPAEVVAGDPFEVNFRVGNVGGDQFPDDDGYAFAYSYGKGRVFNRTGNLPADLLSGGASYHTSQGTASATSTTDSGITPLSMTFRKSGPSWIFTAIISYDGDDDEIGFHGLWHDFMVLSSPTYDPVKVEVDGVVYTVSADADDEGSVTTTVASVDDPDAEIDPEIQEKAQYAAGVRTQLLDGIFERSAIAGLSESADPIAFTVDGPSSSALLKAAAPRYAALVGDSGLPETLADGEAISPVDVENLVLTLADGVSGSYAFLADSWRALSERISNGEALSFDDATVVQSQLAYAENVIAPVISAGEAVTAARAADLGWDDPDVDAMLSGEPSCDTGNDPLSDPLELGGVEDPDALVALDTEMRAALFAYIVAVDNVLCGIESVDAANSRFLERLGLGESEQLLAMIEPEALPEPEPEPEPDPPIGLRIMARLSDSGRVEHGVELASGFQILPVGRFLPADTPVGRWYTTQDVELDGGSIGQINSRRRADGRIELSFHTADGERVTPDIAYLPANPDTGVWYRSSLIEVPAPPAPEEPEEADPESEDQ